MVEARVVRAKDRLLPLVNAAFRTERRLKAFVVTCGCGSGSLTLRFTCAAGSVVERDEWRAEVAFESRAQVRGRASGVSVQAVVRRRNVLAL